MKRIALLFIIFLLGISLVGCSRAGIGAPPTRTAPPSAFQKANTSFQPESADIDHGKELFFQNRCNACHGDDALGNVGPQLAGTRLSFPVFLTKVRSALPPKPAYSEDMISDQGVYDIYAWLQQLPTSAQKKPVKAGPQPVKIKPGQEELPEGPILGMSLWTGFGCSECHGNFAQGGPNAPALAGITEPYELMRAKMRQTADQIPEHDQSYMRDTVLKRLYKWLQEGANPEGGC